MYQQAYSAKYNCTRTILCLTYAAMSIPFMVLVLVYGDTSNQHIQKFLIVFFSLSQFCDSVILCLQLFVLYQQLTKQRPYTPTHIIFCIYLSIISIARLIVACIACKVDKCSHYDIISIAYYSAFLLNSLFLLGYWIAKQQQLPQFQGLKQFDFNTFKTERKNSYSINSNIEITNITKTHGPFIHLSPIVQIEDGKFRIILQIKHHDPQLYSSYKKTNSTMKPLPKVLSNKLYTFDEVVNLYKICGRLNLQTQINLNPNNIVTMHRNLQQFLDELFRKKCNYLRFCLQSFDLPENFVENCELALRDTLKNSEFDLMANIDKCASILSVRIFKQLWIENYYLFYLDVLVVSTHRESRPMKRYTDFQALHTQLTSIIKHKHQGKLELPALPKKHVFNLDSSKINQRRNNLEDYIQNLANDYKLMLKCPEIRAATLAFLGINNQILEPADDQFKQVYQKIRVTKGAIKKCLVGNDYVTFYEFKLIEHGGTILKLITKRFNEFVSLHSGIERWMKNNQLHHRNLILPQKHIYKQQQRHEKLKSYLQTLLTIDDIYMVYEINSFFKISDNSMSDLSVGSISQIRSKPRSTLKQGLLNVEMPLKQSSNSPDTNNSRLTTLINALGQ